MNGFAGLPAGPAVERLGWALVHFLWQGALVALLLAPVLALTRRRSAGARYLACCAALVAMAACPVATILWTAGRASARPVRQAVGRGEAAGGGKGLGGGKIPGIIRCPGVGAPLEMLRRAVAEFRATPEKPVRPGLPDADGGPSDGCHEGRITGRLAGTRARGRPPATGPRPRGGATTRGDRCGAPACRIRRSPAA